MAHDPTGQNERGSLVRCTVTEILATHEDCKRWARLFGIMALPASAFTRKGKRQQQDFNRRFSPHMDIRDAAQKCLAGNGHHR